MHVRHDIVRLNEFSSFKLCSSLSLQNVAPRTLGTECKRARLSLMKDKPDEKIGRASIYICTYVSCEGSALIKRSRDRLKDRVAGNNLRLTLLFNRRRSDVYGSLLLCIIAAYARSTTEERERERAFSVIGQVLPDGCFVFVYFCDVSK